MKREKSRLEKMDIVQSFKREIDATGTKYLYQIIDVAYHSETQEKFVVYKALYEPYDTWVRPYEMFMSPVDHKKYPDIKQEYRFEKVEGFLENQVLSITDKKYDFADFTKIVACLRGEHGCPWDKKQTFESMKICLKNESEEVFQAIDNQDMDNLCEELGDVLLQVVMNSQIATEQQVFDMNDVIQGVSEKLIRRHPHVFGDECAAATPEEALVKWQEIKKLEKMNKAK